MKLSKIKIQPHSFEYLYSPENLYVAWHKVSLGKSAKSSIRVFYQNLDANLASIGRDLSAGTYTPSPYNRFIVQDPKERVISASSVRDRVVQHALMNLYAPVFDRHLIFDTYACRPGKGTHKAVLRAFHFAKNYKHGNGYFLKMDVRKYFDSVSHERLKDQLQKIIPDTHALEIFHRIINSHNTISAKGMPIGNLTSQYFANHYLSAFDHYLKEKYHVKKYVRYMDDMLVFSDNKNELKEIYGFALTYMTKNLEVLLKQPVLDAVKKGAPFLGFLIKPQGIYLQKKSKKRYKTRIGEIEHCLKCGAISEDEAGCRAASVSSHLMLARSRAFRNTVLHGRVFGD